MGNLAGAGHNLPFHHDHSEAQLARAASQVAQQPLDHLVFNTIRVDDVARRHGEGVDEAIGETSELLPVPLRRLV